ncbi:hypothetical protein FI667_g1731, partial [Globisporangium splendens]
MRLTKRRPLGNASASGAANGGGELHPAAPPSLALLVQLGQLLDRQAPVTLIAVGYYLEKKLGGLRFLLVLCYLLVLSQVLFAITAFILAKTFLTNTARFHDVHLCASVDQGSIFQWRVGFSSVLWALKVILNRQYPTLAPGLDISLPTSYMTWLELLGVHFFLPRLSLISQISGFAAGYLFTAIPGTMKLLAKYEYQVDRALRKQGIKLPVKHRWKLVLADMSHQIKTLWLRCKKKCRPRTA